MLERMNSGDLGRPIDALLADYAAGRLARPLHGLVAAHLAIKPENRNYVAALEAVQARAVDEIAPQPLARRNAMLEKIFASEATRGSDLPDDVIPPSLRALAGTGLSGLDWKSKLPGMKEFQIKDKSVGEAVFYWIKPGRQMPSHTHEGTEVTLVLKGGFSDTYGHYRRGDIAIADGEVDHQPRADEDEDCICFAVTDAPLRLTGPLGRMLRIFTRH